MKKIWALFLLYNDQTTGPQTRKESAFYIAEYIAYLGIVIACGLNYNLLSFLAVYGSLTLSRGFGSLKEPKLRMLPITDRFLVSAVLLTWPAICMSLCALLCAGAWAISTLFADSSIGYSCYLFLMIFTSPWIWIAIIFFLGFWFASFAASFSMSSRKMLVGKIMNIIIFGAALWIYCRVNPTASGYRYDNSFMIFGQMITEDQAVIVCFAASCLWTLAAGIYAFRKGLYFLRHDLAGQKEYDLRLTADRKIQNMGNEAAAASSKKTIIMSLATIIVIVLVIVTIWGAAFDFGEGNKINDICTGLSEYNCWGDIPEFEEQEDMEFDGNIYQIIFPETVENVKEGAYYSHVDGTVGEGWYSLTSVRYLKAVYTQEDYEAEKQRVAELKVTADNEDYKEEKFYGNSQELIRDTENFPFETYIAVWDPGAELYEYAMFDDESNTVYYIYAWDSSLDEIETDDLLFAGKSYNVISKEQQNCGTNAYNIYAFDDWGIGSTYVRPYVRP